MTGTAAMDRNARRQILVITANPDQRTDYVVTLQCRVEHDLHAAPSDVELRYVPDRHVLDPESFAAYLDAIAAIGWTTLEELASAILDDIRNELVPRWAQVSLTHHAEGGSGVHHHGIVLEDRQPAWDNPTLLSRLREF